MSRAEDAKVTTDAFIRVEAKREDTGNVLVYYSMCVTHAVCAWMDG